MDKERTFTAIILAPLSSLVVVLLLFIEEAIRNPGVFTGGSIFVVMLFVMGFLSTSLAFVVLVGLPIHYVFSKFNINNVFAYCFTGVIVALLYQYATNMLPPSLASTGYWVYFVSGLFVSFTFWWVAAKRTRT